MDCLLVSLENLFKALLCCEKDLSLSILATYLIKTMVSLVTEGKTLYVYVRQEDTTPETSVSYVGYLHM